MAEGPGAEGGATSRRRYDSPVRRQQAARTRERIVSAGVDLAHELASWDWRELTFRAVAERASVGERTVYRHFPNERQLHDAIMQRLNELAGVDYGELHLDDFAEVAARIFRSLQHFSVGESFTVPEAPTFRDVDAHRRAALLRAVEPRTAGWTDDQREELAAALDVLWHLPSYERLVGGWGMGADRATAVLTWLIELTITAADLGPPPAAGGTLRGQSPGS